MPSFGVPTASHVLRMRSPKLPRVFFFSFFISKTNQKKLMPCFKYIYICIQVHVCFHSGQKMTFYSKTLSLLRSLQMSIEIKYPNVSQWIILSTIVFCATIKYTLIWGTTCNFYLPFFLFQLHKALATFIYSIKVKTAQCFCFNIFISDRYFSNLFIIQLCGSVCFGV